MSARRDVARDFIEVKLHHVVCRHREAPRLLRRPGLDRLLRTDGRYRSVGGLSWPRSALGPMADKTVLLANPGLVFT
jgi:hypothetical protein